MRSKETNNVVEMDLKTRQKLAQGVIMNAKEVISKGLHGKESKKIIALVPVSLIRLTMRRIRERKRNM